VGFVSQVTERPEQITMTCLVTSADGLYWHRQPDRTPFIRLGREGDFDVDGDEDLDLVLIATLFVLITFQDISNWVG